jgi:hypothetical protein
MTTHYDPRADHRVALPKPLLEGNPIESLTERGQLAVVACSLCLSVLYEGAWVEAEEAIRELRSYESPVPVALEAGLCDTCADRVHARRAA